MSPCSPLRRSPNGLALVEEGSLRLGPLLGLPAVIADFGLDPEELFAEADIDIGLFSDPENTIPFRDLGRLLAHGLERSGCPHLGLLVGQRSGLDALGVVGQLAAQCPNVGTAIENIILYLHLHDRGAIPSLWVSGDRAVLAYTIYRPDVPGIEQIYDGALAITLNAMKGMVGPSFDASEVRLCRPRPADIEPYWRHFRCRLTFGAEHSALIFPASTLERPLGGANPLVRRKIVEELEALEAQGSWDLAAQLRRVLRKLLIAAATPGATSLERIADLFAIHRRTLNRRLKAQGTSFRELIDDSRYDIARQLLRDTRIPVLEIASALDYADAAAFTRAFRRWSGTTPAAWRSAHGSHEQIRFSAPPPASGRPRRTLDEQAPLGLDPSMVQIARRPVSDCSTS